MGARLSTYEKQLAQEIKGTPKEYLPNLVQIVLLFRESAALRFARASLRQGWKETLAGETRAVSDLWDDIDAE